MTVEEEDDEEEEEAEEEEEEGEFESLDDDEFEGGQSSQPPLNKIEITEVRMLGGGSLWAVGFLRGYVY